MKTYIILICVLMLAIALPRTDVVAQADNAKPASTAGEVAEAAETAETAQAGDSTTIGLEVYTGEYGARTITMSGTHLQYQREGMPSSVQMKAVGIDEFELVIPAGAQVRGAGPGGALPTIRFNRDSDGAVESLSIVESNGTIRETAARTN